MNTKQSATIIETIVNRSSRRMEDSQATIDMLYGKVTEAVTNQAGYRDLARLVERIAEAEGELEAYMLINRHIANCSLEEIIQERLLEGADDCWSGRTNDAQRSRFEGIRKGFQVTKYWLA